MRKNSGVTELGVAEYLLRDLPRQHGARVHARWWTISSQRRCHHGLTARISSMVTIGLRSSVYRTHGAGHRLWCSFGNLLLLLWWLELARVGVFYYENREQFRSLKLPSLASQTIEAFPDEVPYRKDRDLRLEWVVWREVALGLSRGNPTLTSPSRRWGSGRWNI